MYYYKFSYLIYAVNPLENTKNTDENEDNSTLEEFIEYSNLIEEFEYELLE